MRPVGSPCAWRCWRWYHPRTARAGAIVRCRLGSDNEAKAREGWLMPAVEVLRTERSWIQKRPDVCGGDACIRNLRFPVRQLTQARRLGANEERILRSHPDLTPADLEAAREYHAQHRQEIERALWENVAGGIDYPGGVVPAAVLIRGRQLGLSEEAIREAFDPPLPPLVLEAAWAEYGRRPAEIDASTPQVLPPELVED